MPVSPKSMADAIDVLIVTRPVTAWISPKLHALTGVWNLENLTGHVCVLAAMCALLCGNSG